ncbi:MAG: cardiolipin synthase, partial [Candidatus Cloacimonetes bacterium]|nr:cardiolipin synthase [Candidatus Cloacimonadota bacterium]
LHMRRTLLLILFIVTVIAIVLYQFSGIINWQADRIYKLFLISLAVIYLYSIVGVIFPLVRENRKPSSSLAWVQVILFLPIAGFILYLIFGINYRKRKMFAGKAAKDHEYIKSAISGFLPDENTERAMIEQFPESQLMRLLLKNSQAHLSLNNRIEIFKSGGEQIPDLFRELEEAIHHIHMEYYIIRADKTGQKLSEILCRKARQGVQVRLVYDDVGSWNLPRRFKVRLRQSGVDMCPFFPVKFRFFASRLNYRNHRKIIIIDGTTGYLGGNNIADEYCGLDDYYGYWRDTHIKLSGEAVYALQTVFLIDWAFANGKLPEEGNYYPAHRITSTLPIQIVTSGPDSEWESIRQGYFALITNARKYIFIASPYLILDSTLLTALKTAALADVDVRILLPGKPDHKIVWYGSHSYYEELLTAGVRIYEYEKGFLHSKIVLVDNHEASIGTANMDVRSFSVNFEINSVIYGTEIASKLKRQFEDDFSESREIILENYQQRSSFQKYAESVCRLFSPVL